jgi:hypothetical protein
MNADEPGTGIRILHGLEDLSEDEALKLAATVPVGRVAYTRFAMPAIHVVNFVLAGRDPVFRTRKGANFAAAVADTVVAFEVDRVDEALHTGWTVSFIGRAHLVTRPDEIERLTALGVTPWAGSDRNRFIRVITQIIRGRRIVPEHDEDAGA